MRRRPSRPALAPVSSPAAVAAAAGPSSARSYSQPHAHAHARSASFVGSGGSSSGSFGRAGAEAMQNEFGKYAEDDDEDYDDVFGKANGTGEVLWFRTWRWC